MTQRQQSISEDYEKTNKKNIFKDRCVLIVSLTPSRFGAADTLQAMTEEEKMLKDPIYHYGAEVLRASDPCRDGYGDEMNENLLFRSGDMDYVRSPSRYVF